MFVFMLVSPLLAMRCCARIRIACFALGRRLPAAALAPWPRPVNNELLQRWLPKRSMCHAVRLGGCCHCFCGITTTIKTATTRYYDSPTAPPPPPRPPPLLPPRPPEQQLLHPLQHCTTRLLLLLLLMLLQLLLLLEKVCQLSRHDGCRGHYRRKDKGTSGALSVDAVRPLCSICTSGLMIAHVKMLLDYRSKCSDTYLATRIFLLITIPFIVVVFGGVEPSS